MPRLDGPFNDTFKVCHSSGEGGKFRLDPAKQDDNQPLLLITPTYERAEQVIQALRCPIKHCQRFREINHTTYDASFEPFQTAELTRLVQTLNHVKGDFQWIVVEDATDCSPRVRNLVQRKFATEKGRGFTLLAAQMPPVFRRVSSQVPLPRGVAGRRAALKWILQNTK